MGTRYNRLADAVQTSTHNECFGSKIRNKVYPCHPSFIYIKVGFMGVQLSLACFHDESNNAFTCLMHSLSKHCLIVKMSNDLCEQSKHVIKIRLAINFYEKIIH